jgi:hypothetical protein
MVGKGHTQIYRAWCKNRRGELERTLHNIAGPARDEVLDVVPVFPDRKGIPVHAHPLVCPESHGKWNKVVRFVTWLRREAAAPPSARIGTSSGR